jgi:hypothetical protein
MAAMRQADIRADSKTRWGIVAIALVAGLIAAAYVGKLPPALPAIRAELGLDLISAGYLASLFQCDRHADRGVHRRALRPG